VGRTFKNVKKRRIFHRGERIQMGLGPVPLSQGGCLPQGGGGGGEGQVPSEEKRGLGGGGGGGKTGPRPEDEIKKALKNVPGRPPISGGTSNSRKHGKGGGGGGGTWAAKSGPVLKKPSGFKRV